MTSNAWKCREQPGGCPCTCHKISAGRRTSTKAARRLWTPSMDARLVSGAKDGMTIKVVAQKLRVSQRQALDRLQELGESTRDGWRTRHEVGLALGVTWRSTARWQAEGLLKVSRYGIGRWWRVTNADLDAFIRAHAGILFDADGVRDPALKQVAQVSAIANRRRGTTEAAS